MQTLLRPIWLADMQGLFIDSHYSPLAFGLHIQIVDLNSTRSTVTRNARRTDEHLDEFAHRRVVRNSHLRTSGYCNRRNGNRTD